MISLGTVATGTTPLGVVWSPDGRFVAMANYGNNTLQMYRVNYVSVAESQSWTSSLVFGDSARGSAFDANVQVLSGARVEISGKVRDDSA